MKRTAEENGPPPTVRAVVLPPELWARIVQCIVSPVTVTLTSVFMLNKSINTYLSENSRHIAKRRLVAKLNPLLIEDKDIDPFYTCEQCRKIQLGEPSGVTWLCRGTYCHQCVTKCRDCGGSYMKEIRFERREHFDCASYSPQASDNEPSFDDFDDGLE